MNLCSLTVGWLCVCVCACRGKKKSQKTTKFLSERDLNCHPSPNFTDETKTQLGLYELSHAGGHMLYFKPMGRSSDQNFVRLVLTSKLNNVTFHHTQLRHVQCPLSISLRVSWKYCQPAYVISLPAALNSYLLTCLPSDLPIWVWFSFCCPGKDLFLAFFHQKKLHFLYPMCLLINVKI